MMNKYYRFLKVIIAVSILALAGFSLIMLSCGDDAPTNNNSDDGPDALGPNTIGPKGGTITDTNGVSIQIPVGALAANTEITITHFEDQSELPESMQSTLLNMIGICQFEPDGLVFDAPVTITIPSNQALTPGEQFPLWVWDKTNQVWDQTEFIATASANGLSFSAEVTHFSTLSGDNGWGANDIFGDLDPSHWMDVQQAFQDWYAGFMFYQRNLEYTELVGDCCMEVTGLKFTMNYQGKISYPSEKEFGVFDDYVRTEYISVTRQTPASLHLSATVYWSIKKPEMKIKSSTSSIDLMDDSEHKATIEAWPICDNYSIPGVQVKFTLDGPGTISPTSGTTDGTGMLTATYTADDTGKVIITGEATTCTSWGDPQNASAKTDIQIDSCTNWELYITIEFTHYGENWNFNDLITMYIPIEIKDGLVTGYTGEGGHSATLESTNEHCSVESQSTPDFVVGADGDATDQELTITIAPMGSGFLVDYTFTCKYEGQEPFDVNLPPYTFLLQAIMAGQAFDDLKIPYEKGAQVLGGGTDQNGGDSPISFEFDVRLDCN